MNDAQDSTQVSARTGDPGEQAARQALALVDEQRRQVTARLFPDPGPILAAWGCTYLIGFGALWLSAGSHGAFATWGAAVLLIGLGSCSSAVGVARMARLGRGVDGPSRRSAVTFSWCWPVSLLAVLAFDVGLSRHGVPGTALSLLWPASFLLVGAVLFLCAGVMFGDRAQLGLGLWSLAVAAASTFAGQPANFAVLALAGGVGLLTAAGAHPLAMRVARRGRARGGRARR
ncbi:MAG: hypothetical protein ACRDYD_02350 [Acidimicrobiales bacterium]